MISVLVFFLHIVFAIYILIKTSKQDSIKTGLLNIVFIIIIFSVGWTISTMLVKLFVPSEGFGKDLDADGIALAILAIAEYFFYRRYYKDLWTTEDGTEK